MRTHRCLTALFAVIPFLSLTLPVSVRAETVGFESERWKMRDARRIDHLGRPSLVGTAFLEGIDIGDGVVEVDIAVDGRRSYPGIMFRMQDEENFEHVYIRPHRAGLYPDAIQYAPTMNGISSWQLCNGDGCTAAAVIPENEWIRLRIEFAGTRALVYLGAADEPALVVNDLKHGSCRGAVGVSGPTDGTAFFSNFGCERRDDLSFPPAPIVDLPPGLVAEWELSPSYRLDEIETDRYPDDGFLRSIEWSVVRSDPGGLVNVGRYRTRSGRRPDVVLARAAIEAERGEVKQYLFGYSDAISIFLNGRILFTGSSAYTQRDPSFLGIVGLYDAVYLPLREGENELLIMVAESFGGWGFIFQDGNAVFRGEGVEEIWETGRDFDTPESVLFDPERAAIYVSNFGTLGGGSQFISRLREDGAVENLRWIEGVTNPTGMALRGGRLFVVERSGIAEIDPDAGAVRERHVIPQPGFPNDIAIDADGAIYVSDTRRNVIFRFAGGEWEEWAGGAEISRPNGVCIAGKRLIVGCGGDNTLRAVDVETKRISTVARLAPGNIDGISIDRGGDFLVSHWEGRLYRVSPDGEAVKLLDTSVPGRNIADFAYRPDAGTVIIPTFSQRRVTAYRIEQHR